MSDALLPLRHAYGMEVPQPRPNARLAPGEPGHTEAELLKQGRALLDAAPRVSPSPDVLASIQSEAQRMSDDVHGTLGAVAFVYNEGQGAQTGAPNRVELAVLTQGRDVLDNWATASRTATTPAAASLAAVLARAEAATALAPDSDAPVSVPHLVPLASAYGLRTVGDARAMDPETALLRTARAALDALPLPSPDEATIAAVLAQAAAVAARPTSRRDSSVRSAPDRAAARPETRTSRRGLWVGTATMAGVLLIALVVWPSAPEMGPAPSEIAATNPAPSSPETVAGFGSGVDESRSNDFAADEPARAPAPEASLSAAQTRASVSAPSEGSVALVSTAVRQAPPRPASSRPEPQAADLATASDQDWDLPSDHRVLSLRLDELRRSNAGLAWDAPAEAFGAPAARSNASSSGIQVVREGAPPARARLIRDTTRSPDR